MKLYFSIIAAAMVLVSAVNLALDTAAWRYILSTVVICTALQFVLDGLVALVISTVPDRFFALERRFFRVTEKQRKLYKKLRVHSWKDKVWELGGLGGFRKKNLANPNDCAYVEKFIIECNRGVLVHRLSYPIGFLPMLFVKNICAFSIALPIAMVNLFLNILPTLVLRYNIPKLKAMLARMKRKRK